MLSARGLVKRFGGLMAVDGVDFTVEQGQAFAIVGPNGAGKTTCFNLLTGQIMPDGGVVELEGRQITRAAPHQRTRLGLARTYQNLRLFEDLTALENVLAGLHAADQRPLLPSLLRLPGARAAEHRAFDRAHALLVAVGLAERAHQFPNDLPIGLRKRLDIARALATEPRLLLLDEPAAGMTPPEVRELGHLIHELRDRGLTIVIIEHNVGFVRQIADEVLVLSEGRRIAQGKPQEVFSDPLVLEVYLGRAS
jgi:branched-chain amino acid transport system ATP-binding protein